MTRLGGGGHGDKLMGFQYPGFTFGSNSQNAFFTAEPIQRHNDIGSLGKFLEKFPPAQRVPVGVFCGLVVSGVLFAALKPSKLIFFCCCASTII